MYLCLKCTFLAQPELTRVDLLSLRLNGRIFDKGNNFIVIISKKNLLQRLVLHDSNVSSIVCDSKHTGGEET